MGSGAVTLGSIGGAFGCMGGVLVGAVTGCVPALLTFGLSIPFGAVAGGALGTAAGASVGATTGATAGCVLSHGCYVYRAQIKQGVLQIKTGTSSRAQQIQLSLQSGADRTRDFTLKTKRSTQVFLLDQAKKAQTFALDSKRKGHGVVTDKSFQVTTASAAVVAAAGAGMLIGVPAALFTFGLSIPVCATIGGGLGCATGATTGAAAGGLMSGVTGYSTHKYRKELSKGASDAWSTYQSGTNRLKEQAMVSVTRVTAMVSGTGGTAGGAGSE